MTGAVRWGLVASAIPKSSWVTGCRGRFRQCYGGRMEQTFGGSYGRMMLRRTVLSFLAGRVVCRPWKGGKRVFRRPIRTRSSARPCLRCAARDSGPPDGGLPVGVLVGAAAQPGCGAGPDGCGQLGLGMAESELGGVGGNGSAGTDPGSGPRGPGGSGCVVPGAAGGQAGGGSRAGASGHDRFGGAQHRGEQGAGGDLALAGGAHDAVARICWVSAPRRVRLPPQTLRVTDHRCRADRSRSGADSKAPVHSRRFSTSISMPLPGRPG